MARSNKKFIIEFDAETGEFTKGVGEVKKGLDDVSTSAGEALTNFEGLEGAADNMTGGLVSGFKSGVDGIKNMVKGMATLKGALISTGVGALVVALGSLVAWMKSTEMGAKALRVANVALDIVYKDVADTFASFTTKAIEAKDENDGWLGSLIRGENAVKNWIAGWIGINEITEKATDLATQMVAVQDKLVDSTKEFTTESAELNQEIELNQKVIDDTTKSYSERKAAVDKQNKATLTLANNTRDLAALELETLNNMLDLEIPEANKIELRQEIAQATADLTDAETRLAVIQLDNAQKSREIDLEEAGRKKSIYATVTGLRLEGIEDEGERIEAEFEMRKKQLEDELTLLRASDLEKENAFKLLNDAKLLALKEYNASVLEENNKAREDEITAADQYRADVKSFAAELRAGWKKSADDQKAADLAILSSKQALTKGISQSFGSLSSLMKEGSAESKAMALTEIGINTAVGFIQGLDIAQKSAKAGGPAAAFLMPVFYASQIAAVLAAAAQAKNILKGGGGGPPSRPSTPSIGGSGGSASEPTPPSIDFGFLETGANQTAIQAYVVEQNVSDSQQANQLIQEQSVL
jgi:hypothetical protein